MIDPSFSLRIQPDIGGIPGVSAQLESAMRSAGFSTEDILDTQLAVEEVITNVIVHGYRGSEGSIGITGRQADNCIEIVVTDQAPPFDPLSIPEPDLEADVDERRIGGLGIYLLKQVMDDVSYRFENGSNILTMKKKRN
jgi:serine/threonine-protein kinase RsbW